jgi:hypothetical protein
MSTWLKLFLLPPDLLRVHAQAYADLVNALTARYLLNLKHRCLLYACSVLALWLGLIFGGVALMLWGTLPLKEAAFPWVLWVLPTGLMGISALCWWLARRVRLPTVWVDIQTQIELDAQTLKQASAA